jgi:hypothetical protein
LSARQKLRQGADDHSDQIVAALVRTLDAEKGVWHSCPNCNHKTQVRLPDSNAIVQASKALVELGHGRAKDESSGGGKWDQKIEAYHRWLRTASDEELERVKAGNLGHRDNTDEELTMVALGIVDPEQELGKGRS